MAKLDRDPTPVQSRANGANPHTHFLFFRGQSVFLKKKVERSEFGATRVINGDARQMDLAEFDGPYGVIVADPPWSYRVDSLPGSAASHYNSFTTDDLRGIGTGTGDSFE